jgi:uncharacterized integral membrane protein (TIGR00698 family)
LHSVTTSTAEERKTLWDDVAGRTWGVALCLAITLVSIAAQELEVWLLGVPYVEALVIAILLGMAIRAFWTPGHRWMSGISFSAKQLLEVAVMLMGASLSLAAIAASGPLLLAVVVAIVIVSLVFSYGVSRALGLPQKISILIACGNSICGNSAIAAAAPVISASSDDVGASISFTAILGVITVLGLPLLVPLFDLSFRQYGILAGLTVYAVPQVLAATVPVSFVSAQVGTLVKLIRVLMLGPVLIGLTLMMRGKEGRSPAGASGRSPLTWVPWFIPAFLAFAALRSLGLVPDFAIGPIAKVAGFLTVVSMAALGLGVDLSLVGRAGVRITAAVLLSLVLLIVVSLGVTRFF